MTFVVSVDDSTRGFGVGKLVDPETHPDLIEYFVSPADEPIQRVVDPESISEIELYPQERVFYIEDHIWHVGRLDNYFGVDQLDLRLPNSQTLRISVEDAYVRSDIPIKNPLGLLQTRNTETPFWHEGRAGLVRSLAKQRATYRGLTGLASSNVEIFPHQLTIVRRVLNDPIPRYLLADEVGLGKTIEVGIIIRQHLLDEPGTSGILIIAPSHLVEQWKSELRRLFHIDGDPRVRVVAHDHKELLTAKVGGLTLLIVDEAHHISRHAYDEDGGGAYYRAISTIAQQTKGVLLLSATPVVHNEDAFLAMLHLLDPAAHSLADRDSFHARIAHREAIAGAVRDLEDDASGFFIESALEDLRPLAETNPWLANHLDAVAALIDESDDPERPKAIAALRTHLQESYRLDRRLLRTRRAQNSVCDELPSREHEIWPLQDEGRNEVFEWIDQWRFCSADAADSGACADTLFEFIEAAFSHPLRFAAAIEVRKIAIENGAALYFAEEKACLLRAPEPVSVEDDLRVHALESLIRNNDPRNSKWVIFVSNAEVADEVAAFLSRGLNILRLKADETTADTLETDETSADTVARFRDDQTVVAIVCDETGEDGLNFQGVGAQVVHFDLPLVANRIEQRIGRLDRLRGDHVIRSLVPLLETTTGYANYESAWANCLIEAIKVFDRSVASLQHALDAGRRQLLMTLVDGGVEAITDLSTAWQSEDGALSLEKELRRIENQDLLDELEALEGEHQDFYDELEEYEYATNPKLAEEFSGDINAWVARSLHLELHVMDNGATEYEHTRNTLLPANRFADVFQRCFSYLRRRRGLCTGWMHFDRNSAEKLSLPIVRVGHSFIEDLRRLMDTDDRGRAYACWRNITSYGDGVEAEDSTDLFFRFDFFSEANLSEADELIVEQGLARGAVARRAEDAFPPLFHTIWVDIDGNQVTDPNLLSDLESPYSQYTDTNLREPRWQQVDDLGIVADWSRLCQSANTSAYTLFLEATEFEERISEAQQQLESRYRATEQQLEARVAVLDQRSGDLDALAMERGLYDCLHKVVTKPRVRLDSVGAVFLSGNNPFGQENDG